MANIWESMGNTWGLYSIVPIAAGLALLALVVIGFRNDRYRVFSAFVVTIALILFIGLNGYWPLQVRWLLIVLVMTAFPAYVGRVTGAKEVDDRRGRKVIRPGRFDGILIDARNKISLSYFQILLWTILALSAWSTLVLHRTIPIVSDSVQFRELRVLLDGSISDTDAEEVDTQSVLVQILNDMLKRRGVGPLEESVLKSLYTLLTSEEHFPDSNDSVLNYDPLDVAFPDELLLAMGISTVSLVGASMIKVNKERTDSGRALELYQGSLRKAERTRDDAKSRRDDIAQKIDEIDASLGDTTLDAGTRADLEAQLSQVVSEYDRAESLYNEAQKKYEELVKAHEDSAGLIHVNENADSAKWSDMLSGETLNDYMLVDIAKVQMFFFTIIIVFTYAALVWAQMGATGSAVMLWLLPAVSLPAFSNTLVVLLGISHAGYLSVKASG